MRTGQNPAKKVTQVAKPKRITVAVLTYIPFLKGYFKESLDVLKLCLGSICKNTSLPYDLMVFDNGSCRETKDYLLSAQNEGIIQYLVLSEKNVGKGGAWNHIFNGAPGEIIAYCDSDALLYKGWLTESVRILETFPNVGMVTARPMRTDKQLCSETIKWAESQKGVYIEKGQLISYEEFEDFANTLGYGIEKVKKIYSTTSDIRLTYKDIQAFVGANHFQFVGWKKVLRQFMPLKMNKPVGQVQKLDEAINKQGYLRLMIAKSLVQNMSNKIPEEIKENNIRVRPDKKQGIIKILSKFPPLKKILLWIYDAIFRLYYKG